MTGFFILTLIYFAAIVAAWFVSLVGGMFLARAGLRQSFDSNPGYAMLTLAVLLGLLAAIANPSVYLGFVSAATTILTGFIGMVIGLSFVAAVGYMLSPERVSKYYERTQGWMDDLKAKLASQGAAYREQGVSRDEPAPAPASEEQNKQGLGQGSERASR